MSSVTAPTARSRFRFVVDLDTALAQAAEAAGDGDVAVGGGPDVLRQALAAGKVDELVISTAPVILGAGKRLFDGFDRDMNLEVSKVYSSPYATQVRYSVAKYPLSRPRVAPVPTKRVPRPGTGALTD